MQNRRVGLCLGLFAVLLYAGSLRHGYNMDDHLVVAQHALTSRGISAWKDIVLSSYVDDRASNQKVSHGYRPLVLLSFAAETSLWGMNPALGHLVNVLLYGICVFLLHQLLILWLPLSKEAVFWVVLLFSAHALHSEVVLSLKNRDELLALLFCLGTGFFMVKSFDPVAKRNFYTCLFLAFFCSVLALLSKKSALPTLCVLPIGIAFFRSPSLRQVIWLGTIPVLDLLLFSPIRSEKSNLLFCALLLWSFWFFHRPSSTKWVVLLYLGLLTTFFYPILWPLCVMIGLVAVCLPAHTRGRLLLAHLCLLSLGYFFWLPTLLWFSLITICFNLPDKGLGKPTASQVKLRFSPMHVWWGIFLMGSLLWLLAYDFYIGKILLWCVMLFYAYTFLYSDKDRLRKVAYASLLVGIPLSIYRLGWTNDYLLLLLIPLWRHLPKSWQGVGPRYILLGTLLSLSLMWCLSPPSSHAQNGIDHLLSRNNVTAPLRNEGRTLSPMENSLVDTHNLSERVGTSLHVMWLYAQKCLVPHPLQAYYGYPSVKQIHLSHPIAWLSLLLHAGLLALFGYAWRKKHMVLAFAVLYYLVSLLPYTNLLALVAGMFAERFALYATISASGMIVWGAYRVRTLWARRGILSVCVAVFVGLTLMRVPDWKDIATLMETDIHKRPSAKLHELYGYHLLYEARRPRHAAQHFRASLRLYPDFTPLWNTLGEVYQQQARYEEALNCYLKAYDLDANYHPELLFNVATCYAMLGKTSLAITYMEKLLKKNPRHLQAYLNLAYLYLTLQQKKKAQEVLKQGLAYFPHQKDLRNNLRMLQGGP